MTSRLFLTAFALVLSFPSCAHIARGPAQDAPSKREPPKTCADIFQATFDPDELERAFEIDHYVYAQVRDYLSEQYEPWVKDFMAAARSRHGCEIERDAAHYADDINAKFARLSGRVRLESDPTSPQAILTNPVFNDPQTAVQLACYSECATLQMQATTPAQISCQKQCGTSDLLAGFYENSLALKRIAGLCFSGVTASTSAAKRQEYQDEYAKFMPPYLAKLTAVEASFRQGLEVDRRIVANLARLKSDFQKFRSARAKIQCGPPIYPWIAAVKAASVDLATRQDSSSRARTQFEGSGFYAAGNSARYLVTAAHVSDPDPSVKSATKSLMAARPGAKTPPQIVEFAIRPGLIDLGRDVTLARTAERGPALPLAGAGEIPVAGQRFYLTGFPATAGEKFLVFPCTFLGFGPRYFDGSQKDGSYFLNCPGVPDLRGISGGAAVDAKGRVWGVNVTAEPIMSIIIVSPLSKGADGEPVIGIQNTFVSDLCYHSLSREAYRCEVMPNMYETDVP